ncbi:hypothetical protein HDE79_001974 [Rhodanobacter sp. MP1X3]|nr:hypothetical protein [Rhodanobacter sp. MP1X3]
MSWVTKQQLSSCEMALTMRSSDFFRKSLQVAVIDGALSGNYPSLTGVT